MIRATGLTFLCLVTGWVGLNSAIAAPTIVTERIAALAKLVPFRKITVGPDDQFHGTVNNAGTALLFSRKSDLVTHVCSQDLKSGEVMDWLPLTADSQEPTISPESEVAFTYYKFNARGDICHRGLTETREDKIECLKSDENERSTPFWKSEKELGFLVRNLRTQRTQIMTTQIDTGESKILAEGAVWSPSMRAGGKFLVYNEMTAKSESGSNGDRVLVIQELASGKKTILRFNLPGISGFPSFSDDESYLYFSHYLNDTNNDGVIDGTDNSVVFRVPVAPVIQAMARGEAYFPEQLTSAESNCSFPQPYHDQVYLTCAFEGNLDVYTMPSSGIVPLEWNLALLESGHQTSRTYEERILLLNTLKFRDKSRDTADLKLRLLSDYLLADDITASQYYIRAVQQTGSEADQSFYGLLSIYLEGRAKKKAQPSDEVSQAFAKEILSLDAQIQKSPGPTRFKYIVRGLFRTFLNQSVESLRYLKLVKFDATTRPLERVYGFYLADWTLKKSGGAASLTAIYREMMAAPELSEESRIYYGYRYLQYLETVFHHPNERRAAIEQIGQNLPDSVSSLLKAEAATLKVIEASDDASKATAYHVLDLIMAASRDRYFLRKALYVRSILNFAAAAEFKYLNFIATNWLRYTPSTDTEFNYARQVYARAGLARAYDTFALKQFDLASNYFYGALSLTDDLESHWGYLNTMALKKQRSTIDERYKNLKERQFIDDNLKFVEATLALFDSGSNGKKTGSFDQAINLLKSMTQDHDSSVRYLLLGYCYLQKLLVAADGYEFDHNFFEEAHRNLMLAFDQGRDNDRVKASALINLGILHQRVQNPGLAVKFLTLRKQLGFVSLAEETQFARIYSRSLFYAGQPEQAGSELAEVLSHSVDGATILSIQESAVLRERQAFYAVSAGRFADAVAIYRELLGRGFIQGDLNLAKVHLVYAYALLKTQRLEEARKVLLYAVGEAHGLKPIRHDSERWVDFQPARLKLDVYGLLAQLGSPEQKLDALEKRLNLLDTELGLYDDQLALAIQAHLQIAALFKESNPVRAKTESGDALRLAERLGDSGQYLSVAVFRAAVDFLVLEIEHIGPSTVHYESTAEKIVNKCLKAYDSQSPAAPVLLDQSFKLRVLWSAYSARVIKTGRWDASSLRMELVNRPDHSPELDGLLQGVEKRML